MSDPPEPSKLVAQYETLRKAPSVMRCRSTLVPADALSPSRHVGMARAVAAMSAFAQPEGSRPSNCTTPEEYKPFIYAFAAMTIQTSHQGATP
ncbi:MAG: hypothetical protein HC834_00485 [Rhodospirillales bacterium]|nr:hypothetical protein [Rhodospirillales bacterium]